MAPNGSRRTVKLLVIDRDDSTRRVVEQHIVANGVRLVGAVDNIKNGLRVARGLQPDVVLLEMSGDSGSTLEAVGRLRAELPDSGIILSAHEVSPQLLLNGLRAGAQEFVGRPVDPVELERAIEHVRKLLERMVSSGRRRGAVVSVFGCKGGVGATAVTANLGVSLARRGTTRAAVVDLNLQMGDLALMLNLKPRYSLVDSVGTAALDDTQLRSLMTHHSSGLFLLSAVGTPEDSHRLERHHIVEVFGLLSTMFDYVIVDVGRAIDDRILEVLDLSDRILLLSVLDVPSVRSVSRFLDLFRRLELPDEKLELAVNRFQKKGSVGLQDLESTVALQASWLIPNDYKTMNRCIDTGVPLVVEAPHCKVAQSFQEYAQRLCAAFDSRGELEPSAALTS